MKASDRLALGVGQLEAAHLQLFVDGFAVGNPVVEAPRRRELLPKKALAAMGQQRVDEEFIDRPQSAGRRTVGR